MATTTIDTETELSAVNSILGAIGQSPITTLAEGKKNPEVTLIYNILTDANLDIQNEGWHFNTEKGVSFTPDSSGKITVTNDLLRMDVTDPWKKKQYDVVKRNGYFYDKDDHTDDWSDVTSINLDVTRLFSFEDLPPVFRRYIIYRASRMAATQLVANSELTQLLAAQENIARAACMEYECNQGNHSMFGFPEDSSYTTYQPWRGLVR